MSDGIGDYLRQYTKPCPDCKGRGWIVPRSQTAATCPTCDGAKTVPVATTPKPPESTLFPGPRKEYPVLTAALMYFPHAFAELARCSYLANEQHNPGEPVHWDYTKSVGDGNELLRHLMDALGPNPIDAEGVHHDVKVLWRAAELVERRIRRERGLDK